MNPIARLVLALVVGGVLVAVRPTSAVAWVLGFAVFLVVMGSGGRSGGRSRRRY